MFYTYEEALKASIEYFEGDELAASSFLDKYALRDNSLNLLEKTPEDMHRRISREFARIEKSKYANTKWAPLTEDEIFSYLEHFKKIIPQGSPMYGIGNPYQYISLSNCFVIQSPADSYGGICQADEEIVQISKRRGGVGGDISNFRPSGSITHNAARTSTGIIPLMERYSNSIREVGQNGRRGAEMLTINIHHPESVKLLTDDVAPEPIVVNEGTPREIRTTTEFYDPKNLDFATVKYDATKITGANISIRLTDEFLKAVDLDIDYEQRWPVDSNTPVISKMVNASKVWRKIVRSAWQMAEPGLLFWDNIIRESPADCYSDFGFKTLSTNPCGEIPLSAYDSCRLLVLNLFGFVVNPFTKDAYFDYDAFFDATKVAQRLMDDLIDLEIEKITSIIKKIEDDPECTLTKERERHLWQMVLDACEKGRRTGTGITGLADCLAAIGIAYGSEEGIATVERIYKTLKFAAYTSSIEMAEQLGAFPVWNHDLENNNPFLNRIRNESCELNTTVISGEDIWEKMKKHGRRNIALLTTAPAGTVSIMTQTSSGIEPQFSILPFTRRKKGNPGDVNFRSDFVDQNGDHWMEFEVLPPKVQMWKKITGEKDLTKSPWHENCAEELNWVNRVRLQSQAQKHVDHSISSTLNLPNNVTEEKVDEIYRTAWKSGCKGITIYRDGCRTGVLVKKQSKISKTNAPHRPKDLPCDVFHIKVRGNEYFVLVGIMDSDPYEVFAGKNVLISKKISKGVLTKRSKGKYDAVFDDNSELKDVADHLTDEEEAVTRMVSTALRHGADVKFIVHQLQKTKGNLFGFAKAMSRALSSYLNEETAKDTGEKCPDCGDRIIRSEGCLKCVSCTYSKCS